MNLVSGYSRHDGLWTSIALMFVCAMTPYMARSATTYPTLALRAQFARADHVVQAKIVEIRHPGARKRDQPVGSCGVLYRIRILEQFKGQLEDIEWFATHQILFAERPLSVGDQILVLLRDLNRDRPTDSEFLRAELEQSYAAVRACGHPSTSLYLAGYEENIFPIVVESAGANRLRWLEYKPGRTTIPSDIGPTRPARCETLKQGGCVQTRAARVAWPALSGEIKKWLAEEG